MPNDLAACHAMIQLEREVRHQLTEQLDNANRRISQMEHQLEQLLRRIYGRSAEKLDPAQSCSSSTCSSNLQPAGDCGS